MSDRASESGAIASLGSIRATLVGWFLVIALGSVAIVAILASYFSVQSLERAILSNLAALAETRAVQIEELVDSRVSAVSRSSRDPSIVEAFDTLLAGERPSVQLSAALGTVAEGLGLSSLSLVALDGRALASFGMGVKPLSGADLRVAPWAGGPLAAAVDRASTLLQADIAGLQPLPGRRRPGLFVAGPVFDGPRVAGVLVAQIDEAPIDAAIGDVTGLGETGQTVAVFLDGTSLRLARRSATIPTPPASARCRACPTPIAARRVAMAGSATRSARRGAK